MNEYLCQHGNYHCNICEVVLLKKVIEDYQNSMKEILTLSEVELDYDGTLQAMSNIYKTALFSLPKEMI